MAPASTIKVLERCQISPPPWSTPPTTLPLTFFDIPWLLFSPSQPLFFYQFPHSTTHQYFTSTILPNLKHSLSLTLQHFYPFAGTLTSPPTPTGKIEIVYADGNSVPLTVAESDADFDDLCKDYPRDVKEFYSLVPHMPSCFSRTEDTKTLGPLLAVQITVFGNSGLCIGLAYHLVVSDERTFNNFIKTWALICRSGEENYSKDLIKSLLPVYDRSVIIDTNGLAGVLLKEWWTQKYCYKEVVAGTNNRTSPADHMVRATFVVSPTNMDLIKQWIIAQCNKKNTSPPLVLSAYVLACSFVWVCLIKAQAEVIGKSVTEEPSLFGFVAGGITRLDFPVPATYFGNCIAFGHCMVMRNDLVREDGIVAAAEAIGNTIKKLDKAVLGEAEKWIEELKEVIGSELHVLASGSPKVDLYGTDFGWGKPKKIEDVSIDKMGAISLTESREMKGGIEVGIVLSKAKMDAFSSLFIEGLKTLS